MKRSKPTVLNSLSPLAHDILRHVSRYGLTVPAVVQRLFYPRQRLNVVYKALARLCDSDLLRCRPLLTHRVYYVLGPAAQGFIGGSKPNDRQLGAQSLPISLATLLYATAAEHAQQRCRLTLPELRDKYPWLGTSLLASPYCLDSTTLDAPVLELIRVDLGGKADHVARKCRVDIDRRHRLAEFQSLIREQAFRLVVLTPTPEKSSAIQAALDRHHWPTGLAIRLVTVPQLFSLLRSS